MNHLVARRVIADKYRLDRALAAGGMGSVWSAWNMQLDVPVAIKFMAPALAGSQELVARFEREARAAAQLRSSAVVQIFEHGVDEGQPFIVMELLSGEDLGQRIRRVGRLSIEETAHIVMQVCRALRRAHGMGIVHRDLKPANIFLARVDEDDDEVVKVLDFGVVKSLSEAVESGVTKTGELIGTPHYMSPEQARSTKTVDHRSDLWSLGIIAYRALTASLPFPNEEGIEMLMRVCNEPVPPPSSFAPDLGPEVDAFFERALAIAPDGRFQSAREMADAMCALAGEPLSSRGYRGPSSSIADAPPLSCGVYTAQAYVYTSASDSELPLDSPRGSTPPQAVRRPSVVPPARGSGAGRQPSRSWTEIAPGSAGGEAAREQERDAESPTRVSAAAPHGAYRSSRPPRPAPVKVIGSGGREAGDRDDAAANVQDELSTLSSAGLAKGSSSLSSVSRASPLRLVILSSLFAALLGAMLFALATRRADGEADAAPPKAAKISWASALGTNLTPSTAAAEEPGPALAEAPSTPTALAAADPPPGPGTSNDPGAPDKRGAAPDPTAPTAAAGASPSSATSASPSSATSASPATARSATSAPSKKRSVPRSEGGIGRRPTY